MAELANCSRCGTVFVMSIRDTCRECYKKEEADFQIVYGFLKKQKNRQATINVIVEETGVSEELIIKFVKEKRLTPKDFPMLAYPCERCGKDIRRGKICTACSDELQQDLAAVVEEDNKIEEREKQNDIYFTMNKHKK